MSLSYHSPSLVSQFAENVAGFVEKAIALVNQAKCRVIGAISDNGANVQAALNFIEQK